MAFPVLTEWLFNNLGALIPVIKIHSYERGVKFRWGKDIGIVKPGIWLYLPYVESIESVDVQEQTHNLLTQSMTSKDDKIVTFSCNLTYKVTNARKKFTVVHNFDESIQSLVMMTVADEVSASTFKQLTHEKLQVEARILDRLNLRVTRWGAKIIDFAFTDLVQARVYRLFGDTPGT